MVADHMANKGAMASAAMILTELAQNGPVSAPQGLKSYVVYFFHIYNYLKWTLFLSVFVIIFNNMTLPFLFCLVENCSSIWNIRFYKQKLIYNKLKFWEMKGTFTANSYPTFHLVPEFLNNYFHRKSISSPGKTEYLQFIKIDGCYLKTSLVMAAQIKTCQTIWWFHCHWCWQHRWELTGYAFHRVCKLCIIGMIRLAFLHHEKDIVDTYCVP